MFFLYSKTAHNYGFLPSADSEELREEINSQLEWMYENLGNWEEHGAEHKILWRCSVNQSDRRCTYVICHVHLQSDWLDKRYAINFTIDS